MIIYIWSIACIAKLNVMNSHYHGLRYLLVVVSDALLNPTTGCSPASALPTQSPAKPDSVIGESITLRSPNRSRRPSHDQ